MDTAHRQSTTCCASETDTQGQVRAWITQVKSTTKEGRKEGRLSCVRACVRVCVPSPKAKTQLTRTSGYYSSTTYVRTYV